MKGVRLCTMLYMAVHYLLTYIYRPYELPIRTKTVDYFYYTVSRNSCQVGGLHQWSKSLVMASSIFSAYVYVDSFTDMHHYPSSSYFDPWYESLYYTRLPNHLAYRWLSISIVEVLYLGYAHSYGWIHMANILLSPLEQKWPMCTLPIDPSSQ